MVVAGDFKNGITFDMDGQVMSVIEFQHVKPGKGAAFVRTKLRNVCDLTFGVTGKNLLMIYCKAPFDPEAVASTTDNYYQGLDYFMTPNTRNIGFNIRLNF